jgi:uncharacterized protein (TIGR03067 family)
MLALAFAAPPRAFADPDKSDEKLEQEVKKLQGSWDVVMMEIRGVVVFKAPDEAIKEGRLIFSGRTYNIKINGLFEELGEFRLGLATTPKTMDVLTNKGGLNDGKTILWIYALDGDTLTMCGTGIGGVHPKEFVTKPDSPDVLIKLKRVKP